MTLWWSLTIYYVYVCIYIYIFFFLFVQSIFQLSIIKPKPKRRFNQSRETHIVMNQSEFKEIKCTFLCRKELGNDVIDANELLVWFENVARDFWVVTQQHLKSQPWLTHLRPCNLRLRGNSVAERYSAKEIPSNSTQPKIRQNASLPCRLELLRWSSKGIKYLKCNL